MTYFVDPRLYEKYKTEIFNLSLAIQKYTGTKQDRKEQCLSDEEIADKLNLNIEDVQEIRCIAELDMLTLLDYEKAEKFKNRNQART